MRLLCVVLCVACSSPPVVTPDGGTGGGTSGSGGGSSGTGGGTGGTGGGTGGTSGTGGGMTGTGGGAGGGSGGAGGGFVLSDGGTACTPGDGRCTNGTYCFAPGCVFGECRPIPPTNTVTEVRQPQCGCDDITYWNATVAAAQGVSIRDAGACSPGVTCGGFAGLDCPGTAFCNYRVPNMTDCNVSDQSGSCWALPPMCPQIVIGPTSRRCIGGPTCIDECTVIRQQQTWWVDNTCPQ
jgi:hypothetical protein